MAKTKPKSQADFVPETVLKRDIFSETISGHLASDPSVKVALRKLDGVPWYARPLSQFLARKEVRGLRAVQGIEGVPVLLAADKAGILRIWSKGTPLHLAKPSDPLWFHDAKRLLRDMKRRGVCHNDIAKPQNWLMTPDGRAAVIDFQLASVHKRRGKLFRIAAREDLRHMLKQKRAFAPHLLTPTEKKMLARKSLPSRIWMATGKKLYNFITRRLMHWSDGEGSENRIEQDGPAIRKALLAAGATDVAFATFAMSAGGVGIYAFVEGDLAPGSLPQSGPMADLTQIVTDLPRDSDGTIRTDLLELIATNRLEELDQLLNGDAALHSVLQPITIGRLNLTDRRLR
ncbi:serine/threonine protein kinase [Thalassovita gelatinovora]|uniref:Serine/threonine protein kinase n=1 Tax=Thalassovita gelatinovora TaxID=53501 RepID=A0A0P1F613_THAGE|nr:phosphotransferase [Thalassovita gelatinovora]CUH63333.1 serine/threonine protein kinase [Thalassovita gelatinovora]SEQ65327.1 serine/threonine protein kinase [Thalassovita gelatinovora]